MRYLPHTDAQRQDMLRSLGVNSVDDLFHDVPMTARLTQPLGLPHHKTEMEVDAHISRLAAQNMPASQVPSFLGAGAYRHHVPASVDALIQRGEFLTSYTPYQPEVSQGTLQYLYEFQTQICLITGMEVANASMYDGSTACAEAVMMANRITRRTRVMLSGTVHPHYRDVVRTHASLMNFECVETPVGAATTAPMPIPDATTSCVVVQTPDFFGHPHDVSALAQQCHAAGALLIVVVTEVMSLGALRAPGHMGADIVVAEGQSLGNGLNFGGPYVGLFATREKFMRQMPGRLVGKTKDRDGRDGFVLTLSTREQHIRREKATSNICTNSGLCALAFTIHLSLLGEEGFRDLALINHARAVALKENVQKISGVSILNTAFFNEFSVRLPKPAVSVVDALARKKILGGVPATRLLPDEKHLDNVLILAATELTTDADMDALIRGLTEVLA